MTHMGSKKQAKLTGLHQREYILSVLETLKAVAFHEIYMQKEREQLAADEYFHYGSVFKHICMFGQGRVVGYELRGFMEEQTGATCSNEESQELVCCLNKGLFAWEQADYLELVLPSNIILRNKMLARNQRPPLRPGQFSKLYDIKSTSQRLVASFLGKEIKFHRQLLVRKRDFCAKYGGDLYTFQQLLKKRMKQTINFEQLSDLSRSYGTYFNPQQFTALYRRVKTTAHPGPIYDQYGLQLQIKLQDFTCLFVDHYKRLDIKQKISLVSGIPLVKPTPSYAGKLPSLKYQETKAEEEHAKKLSEVRQQTQPFQKDIRNVWTYSRPSVPYTSCLPRWQLQQKQKQWQLEVATMGDAQIDIRYSMIRNKVSDY